jgi:hypothetical protein
MTPGIYHNIPFEDYRRWPAVNQSTLKEMTRSPAHARAAMDRPRKATPAMLLGSAVDCLVFEGDSVFRRRFSGVLSGKDIDAAHGIKASLLRCRAADDFLIHESFQVSAVAELEGALVKARPDIVCEPPALADLKTTKDASPDAFAATAYRLKYHWQAALYLDVMTAASGETYDEFYFIVVERDPPHRVEVYRLGAAEIEQGREEYRAALAMYADCEQTNNWPTTTGRIQPLSFPDWATR